MRSFHLLLIFTSVVAIESQSDLEIEQFPREVTIDAAFRHDNGDLILISQYEYMAITPNNIQRYIKVRSGNTEVPARERLQAAVNWPRKPSLYFYGKEHSFNTNIETKTAIQKDYAKYREFLQGGGPDAAAYKGGWFYIFKDCQYVAQTGTLYQLGEPRNITDIDENLPCNIDAAWTDVSTRKMTLLKGDEIWFWNENGDVIGPIPFEEEYLIWSWQLKPTTDRFVL